MKHHRFVIWCLAAAVACTVGARGLRAQIRVRFPESNGSVPVAQLPSNSTTPPAAPPSLGGTTPSIPSTPPISPPAGTTPSFDPYAGNTGGMSAPSLLGSPAPTPNSGWSAPGVAPPPGTGSLGAAQPQTPPALFPNGLGTWNPNNGTTYGSPPMRFLYGPRVRYAWLYPKNGDREFGSNDIDTSVTLAVPNFLWSGRPLFVTPAFGLHLWDGPKPPVTSDLPSKAYDAYLDGGWSTDPARILGGEVGVRVGLYSDFNALTVDTFRIQGLAQFHLQMTPSVRVTGGVLYLNRNRFKLFPTAGILWEPNSRTRLDFYFPRPKLSKYLMTIGNYDLWGYLGAEYGGGAWTIEHPDGGNDRIDINDVRLFSGIEWGQSSLMKKGKRIGFIESGWVTEREIIYVARPGDSVTLSDTFMIRAGFGY